MDAVQRAAVALYHDLVVREHAAGTREQLARAVEGLNLHFYGKPICNVLRPFFIGSRTYDEISRAASLVARGLTAIARHLGRDAAARSALGLTEEEERLVRLDPGEPTEPIGRLDGFIAADGTIRFIEYNATPGGFVESDELAGAFSEMPVMRSFGQHYATRTIPTRSMVFDALICTHRRKGGIQRPNIAVLSEAAPSGDTAATSMLRLEEMPKLIGLVANRGCEVRVVDPGQLELQGEHLFAEEYRIDAVIVADWAAAKAKLHGDDPLWRAVGNGTVWIINSAATAILRGSKSVFALLSDASYWRLLEPEVAAAVARNVPWTRRVQEGMTSRGRESIDLASFIAKNREALVLKPADEYGGTGVVLGWECDESTWAAALDRALATPYVVQERVHVPAEPFPSASGMEVCIEDRFFDVNPFIWNDVTASGCLIRLSDSALMNQSAGSGSQTPMFIL